MKCRDLPSEAPENGNRTFWNTSALGDGRLPMTKLEYTCAEHFGFENMTGDLTSECQFDKTLLVAEWSYSMNVTNSSLPQCVGKQEDSS